MIAAGKEVLAPVGGTLTQVENARGGICLRLDGGGSMYLGHLDNRRGNGRVEQGTVIGKVAPAGQMLNGGYAHVHITASPGTGCGSVHIPLSAANNMKFVSVPDPTYSGARNQWAGTQFRR